MSSASTDGSDDTDDTSQQRITDPTRSQTKRTRFEQEFSTRWRAVRGDLRHQLQRGALDPTNDRPLSRQEVEFREYLEAEIEQTVLEPTSLRHVRSGRHWTDEFVTSLYTHGIEQADRSLRQAGMGAQADQLPATDVTLLWDSEHKERLRQERVEVYLDLVDVAHATVKDVYRSFRDGLTHNESRSWLLDEILGSDGRLAKVGEYRSGLIVSAKSIETINYASIERYRQAGLEVVGVEPEMILGDSAEASASHTHTHDCDHDHSEELTADRDLSDLRQVWETAGDNRVCDQCASFAGDVYTVAELRDGGAPMPVRDTHPGCRCHFSALNPSADLW